MAKPRARANMPVSIVPMEEKHVRALRPQPAQTDLSMEARVALAMGQRQHGPCWAALAGGDVIAVAGVCVAWEGRAICWALLSRKAGRSMIRLTRAVRAYIEQLPYRRLELCVDAQFRAGCRWAGVLGFTLETPEPMQCYMPNGNAGFQFSLCRPGHAVARPAGRLQ